MKLTELKLFEQQCLEEWENDSLFEMAKISSKQHGINNVIIWVGQTNKRHGLRVKVSNIKNKFSLDDHFVIRMPSLDYDPKQVANWIDMKPILSWIKLNQKLLNDYENGLVDDTGIFLDNISKI